MPFLENSVVLPTQGGEKIVNVRGFKAGSGLGLIITDITAQSKVEQALRKSEESYKTLVENINEGIAMLDEYGVISYINEKFVKAQGFVPAEVIGHSIKEFIDKGSIKVVDKQMEKSRMGWHEPYEIVWRKKDGGRTTTLVSPTPIHEKGRYFGSIAVLTDISDRRRVEEELSRSRERLRSLSRHLQSVREEESKRIAREIHDELGQALTALKMDLSWLSGRLPEGLPDRKAVMDKTRAMSALMDKTIQTVQKISSELRPGLLDDLGLLPAIEWQAQEFQERTNINCQLEFECESLDLDPDLSTAIFRVFQEALTNVARHSQADSIVIHLKKSAGKMELRISDNGVGIPEKAVHAADSLGLMGMRERLLPFGGELTISGEHKVGTTLTVVLPLKGHKAND
jgi:two-component system sensor histidine kinase UhpB